MAAFRAFQAEDEECYCSCRCFHAASVIPVNTKTAGMAAGAKDAVNLK